MLRETVEGFVTAIAHPMSLSRMAETITSSPQIGIVGGLILYYEPGDVVWSTGGKLDVVAGMIWSDGLGQTRQMPLGSYVQRQKSDFRVILLHFPLMLSALFVQLVLASVFELLLLRKSEVTRDSGFRARLNGFCENLKNFGSVVSKRKRMKGWVLLNLR